MYYYLEHNKSLKRKRGYKIQETPLSLKGKLLKSKGEASALLATLVDAQDSKYPLSVGKVLEVLCFNIKVVIYVTSFSNISYCINCE